MEPIQDTLHKVMRAWEAKVKTGFKEDAPEAWLRKILTKKERGHLAFRSLRRGVLNADVDSSTWLYYFNLHKARLLGKLRKQSEAIKDIRFYLGEIR